MPRKASVLAALAAGVPLLLPVLLPASASLFAATGAEAATSRHVYTRKRVNGRWITGRFASLDLRPAGSRRGVSGPADIAGEAAPLPPARPGAAGTAAARPAGPGPLPFPALQVAALAPAGDEPRMERLRPGLEARARSIVTDSLASALPLPELPAPVSLDGR
jgi:hypothetical protein